MAKLLVLGLAFALLCLLLVILFVRFTSVGERLTFDLAEHFGSTADRQISIEGASGLLTGNLHITRLTIADTKGPFLVIDDLSLGWSPLALIGAKFTATDLTVASAGLDRLPVQTLPAPAPSTEPLTLPVSVDLEHFAFKAIRIGAALAGKDLQMSADGALSASPEALASRFSIRQTGSGSAGITADLEFRPGDDLMKANISTDEPQGGLVATILQLKDAPPLSASLTGNGPLSDWKGKLTAAIDGATVLTLDGQHQSAAANEHQVTLSGTANIEPFAPASFVSLVKGTTTIDLAATLSGQTRISVAKASLVSGALTLDAHGSYDLAGISDLSAHLAATADPVSLSLPLAQGQTTITFKDADFSLFGPAASADLALRASIPGFTTPDVTLSKTALKISGEKLDLVQQTGAASVSIAIGDAVARDPNIARVLEGPVSLNTVVNLSGDTIAISGLDIESGRIGGKISGTVSRSDFSTKADLKIFAAPQVLPDAIAAKINGSIGLSAHVETQGTASVTLSDLAVTSNIINASGNAQSDGHKVDADIKAIIPDIGVFVGNGSGAASINILAKGPITTPDVSVDFTSASLQLAGKAVENLKGSFAGILDPKAPKGVLSVGGTVEKQPIDIKGTVSTSGTTIEVPDLAVAIGSNHLDGNIQLVNGSQPNGKLQFRFPDLSLVAALAGQAVTGNVAGQISLASQDGKTGLVLTAKGTQIRQGDAVISEPDIELSSDDLLKGQISGTIKAKSIASGANLISALSLDFKKADTQTGFNLAARYDGAPLKLSGTIVPDQTAIVMGLDSFSASPNGIAVSLAKPTDIRIESGQAILKDLAIQTGKGTVFVSGTAGPILDLSVRISGLPASLANSFSPGLGATGSVSGDAKINGPANSPKASFGVDWQGASLAQLQTVGIAPLRIKTKGAFEAEKLSLDTSISGDGGLSLNARGTVALASGPGIDISVAGTVPFGLVRSQLAGAGFTLDGTAAVNLKISGTGKSPAISGTVTTKNSKLVDVRRNLTLNAIATTLTLSGQELVISSFSGNLAGGGSIAVSGKVGTAPASGFPADLAIKLANTTYSDGSLITASATGDLTIRGPLLSAPVLGGTVNISKASITIPEKVATSLSGMNIQHKNASADVKAQSQRVDKATRPAGSGKTSGGGINLDLTINAPSQFFVRGRGIDAELGGSLTLKGNSASPVASGSFKMLRGRLLLLDKRLDFTSGTIGFGGDLVPTLDMVATSSTGSTNITVTIAGNATDPAVTFASSPSLPQDEVLAQLIFGRSLTSLSGLQIAKLADAVAQLSGGGSTSLFNKLRSGLGVDDLDVTTDEKGNAAVKAGKYLNDKTYIELQQGGTQGEGKATINLDIGKGVKLKGGVGSNGSSSGGIFYEKEY